MAQFAQNKLKQFYNTMRKQIFICNNLVTYCISGFYTFISFKIQDSPGSLFLPFFQTFPAKNNLKKEISPSFTKVKILSIFNKNTVFLGFPEVPYVISGLSTSFQDKNKNPGFCQDLQWACVPKYLIHLFS